MRRAGRPSGRRALRGRLEPPVIDREAESTNDPQDGPQSEPAPEPQGVDINEATMDRLARMIAGLIQAQQPQPQQPQPPPQQPPQQPPPPTPHRDRTGDYSIERARKVGAENFDGQCDPDTAYQWLENTERVFNIMGCPDSDRVSLASFLLRDRAFYWWEAVQRKATGEIVWAEFKRQFYDYFFPMVYQNARINEFYQLHQGGMTVEQYERRFTELARAAPFVADNEVRKCTKFRDGLRQEIRVHISPQFHYGPLVEEAIRVESDLGENCQGQRGKQKRYDLGWSTGGSSSKSARTMSSSGRSSGFK